jgi:hypothetical protein
MRGGIPGRPASCREPWNSLTTSRAGRPSPDAAAFELGREGLGEHELERLGPGVGRPAGHAEAQGAAQSQQRGNVDHGAGAAGDHARQRGPHERGRGRDVDRHDAPQDVGLDLGERPVARKAGVIDEQREALLGSHASGKARHVRFVGQVGHDDLDLRTGLRAQFRGERLEALDAARHDDQVVTVARQQAGQRTTDTRRGAGDEGEGPRSGHVVPPGLDFRVCRR